MFKYKVLNNEIVAMQQVDNEQLIASYAKGLLPYDNLEWQETEREIVNANGVLCFADSEEYNALLQEQQETVFEQAKQAKITELKSARDAEEQAPIAYNGYRWDIDDKSLQRINGAIIALSNGGSINWTGADNEIIRGVTADDLRGVIGATAERSNMLHEKYRLKKEELNNAKTLEEARAIKW